MAHHRIMRAALLVLCLQGIAAADSFVPERAVVVGRVGDGAWSDAATEARIDQKAELAAVVVGKRGRRRVVLAPPAVVKLRLAGAAVRSEPLSGVRVQWSTVEPHGFRKNPAKNGITTQWYSNVSQESGSYGRWMGYDRIDYFERVVAPWSDHAIVRAAVTSGEPGAQQVPGLGTVRYKVEVELDGVRVASPGKDVTDTAGIAPSVHRVSIRRGDDFLGRLSSYLLVPEVFGSAGAGRMHQTDRYTGADCADVMVGAIRRTGRAVQYTNVASLGSFSRTIHKAVELDDDGKPSTPITGIKPGDLIRIDYGGTLRNHTPRDWDHVAAIWEDKSDPAGPHKGAADGKLDGFDLVIHMGHPRLVIEALSEQAPATIDVLRWR